MFVPVIQLLILGLEAKYRNKMADVQRFFQTFHEEHYKVYNLCSEREYNSECFARFDRFPFADHNPPPFRILVDCVEDVATYLALDKSLLCFLEDL